MRKLIKLVVVLIVLLIVGAVAAYIYIDQLAKAAVERGGTYALGVDTTVDSVSVGLFSGEAGVSGLHIANPGDFPGAHFMTLGEGDLAVSLASLREDVVEVPRLHLSRLDVILERKGGAANYQPILESLKRFETEPKPDAKRFIINEVLIEDIVVHLDLLQGVPSAGLGTVDLPIDEIRLQDVGSESDRGVILAELVDIIVKAVMDVVVSKGGDLIPDDIAADLRSQLGQLQSLEAIGVELASQINADIDRLRQDLEEQLGGDLNEFLGDDFNRIGEGIGGGIGRILGGDDDDEDAPEEETPRERRRRDRENNDDGESL